MHALKSTTELSEAVFDLKVRADEYTGEKTKGLGSETSQIMFFAGLAALRVRVHAGIIGGEKRGVSLSCSYNSPDNITFIPRFILLASFIKNIYI